MEIKGETSSFTIHTANETNERQVDIVIGGERRRMSRLLISLMASLIIMTQ